MFKKKTFLGIIVARKNSKRLQNKNLKKLLGRPLIWYTINSAKKCKFLDRVIISSECPKILKMARKFHCETPFVRPRSLSLDSIVATEVVYHAIKKINIHYDYLVLLQPTSPLRSRNDIDNAIKQIVNQKANSLISVFYSLKNEKFSVLPIKKYFKCKLKEIDKYYINGAIYICNTKIFLKKKTFYLNKIVPFLMKKNKSVDIDFLSDFTKAERILKASNKYY